MKASQVVVLQGSWNVTETVTGPENVTALENEIAVATGAQTLRVEVVVAPESGTDVIEAALELDRTEPAHGLAEMIVGLEADHDQSMTTMSEADLEDAMISASDQGWRTEEREADPDPEQKGGIEAGIEEMAHAHDWDQTDRIEFALAHDVIEAVRVMPDLALLIIMILAKEIVNEIGTGLVTVIARETIDLPLGDEVEKEPETIVNQRSRARRPLRRPLKKHLKKSPKRKRQRRKRRRNHLIAEAVLDHEPPPLPYDQALARYRMNLKSGRGKRSGSERKKPRPIWRRKRTPETRACRSQDSTTRRTVVRNLPIYAAAGSQTILTDIRLEAARSAEGVLPGPTMQTRTATVISTGTETETVIN
jgi:hypothetical protein